jgi:catechol 2,3-dioxygenase-like lactoylglutathione lyase family enzyme
MAYVSSIIVVEDILRSRQLYEKILQLKVTADFGINHVGFEGGLSLYRRALLAELIGRQANLGKHHNLVLYFEVDNLAELEREIAQHGLEFIHRIKEQPWKQRAFRFYDYDQHVLEIAERMDIVFRRLIQENTIEETARLTGYTVEQVCHVLDMPVSSRA